MHTSIKRRLRIVSYFLLTVLTVFVVRLYFLQVMSGELYAQMAQANITRTRSISAPRGDIYDRNGKLLVKSIPVIAVAVEPHVLLKNDHVIRELSRSLDIPYREITKKLEESNIPYVDRVILKQDIDYPTMIYLKENSASLPGVEVVDVFLRQYNYGFLAAHILGYIGEINEEQLQSDQYRLGYEGGDQIGLTGVEEVYEQVLKGFKGKIVYEVDPLGRPTNILTRTDYVKGNDLYLTIDIELQKYTEEMLHEHIMQIRSQKVPKSEEYFNAPGGAAVVLSAKTGEVLAMATYPTYDPSVFTGGISTANWRKLNDPENKFPLNNRAMMAYPSGSVFKAITSYAGLAEEVITKTSAIMCGGIWLGLGRDFPKTCFGFHGANSFVSAMRQSCNSYFYEVGLRLYLKNNNAGELLQKYSRLFGFGSPTGVDLPFEGPGTVPDRDWKKEYFRDNKDNTVWFPGDTVNMAIGQGDVLITPLQLARSYMLLATGGTDHAPHVAKEIRDPSGGLLLDLNTQGPLDLDMDKEIIATIEQGLVEVIRGGTAASSFSGFPLNEIVIAGKTGTAEFFGRQDFAWFACYAPVEQPEYVIAVMIEEAGGGGRNAAPVARKILEYLYNLN